MENFYQKIVMGLRSLMTRILEPHLDLTDFLSQVTQAAKELDPQELESRVYEVDFIENRLYLKTSTQVDVSALPPEEKTYTIKPRTITGDAIIENRTIIASKTEGYAHSRFREGEEVRAAFPIEFFDPEMPEGRTKYVLVVDKKGPGLLPPDIIAALKDYSFLAGLAISIKELRDKLGQYYEHNRNLVLTGRHTAAIAHDIRSLNIGIGGFLNLALRRLEIDADSDRREKLKKHLSLARDNSAQIEALLKNMAHFSRSRMYLNRDTDLVEVVADKINSLANRTDYGGRVQFDVSLPESPSGFLVDRDWFGTVIENIVKNSFEAGSGEVRIKIRLEENEDGFILSIEDNCGGIPLDLLPEIFTPFKSGKSRGQGLGLANAKKVVEEHGGQIEVRNFPGQSAAFIIGFKLHPARTPLVSALEESESPL